MACGTPLLLLFFNLLIFSSTGKPNGVCISQGGRFAPFSSEGKPPSIATKGAKDLTLCRVFRKSTCCDVAQTHPALLTIRRLASAGEANQECLQLWELLECSICDPRVGVQPGPPLICTSFCDKVFQACSNAYFSEDAKTQVLSPCGFGDFVCGRVSEWASNGTELCQLAGFATKSSEDNSEVGIEPSCYGGKASLDSIADSWRTSKSGVPKKTQNRGSFKDFQQWVREMPFNERVSWAVGGMVLTAGLLFVRSSPPTWHFFFCNCLGLIVEIFVVAKISLILAFLFFAAKEEATASTKGKQPCCAQQGDWKPR
ncbi:Folate receptor-like [Macleaya cordata]|uniref:Folate receptor-like n=1 Tax=Macleaya cordata TaxID=56857 RepID=A0A200PWQ4_MACCD|nr:Folate receptor-like [Macleaya cordata]